MTVEGRPAAPQLATSPALSDDDGGPEPCADAGVAHEELAMVVGAVPSSDGAVASSAAARHGKPGGLSGSQGFGRGAATALAQSRARLTAAL